jgi:hypothetical protein
MRYLKVCVVSSFPDRLIICHSGWNMMSRHGGVVLFEYRSLSFASGIQCWAVAEVQSEAESTRVLSLFIQRSRLLNLSRSGIREDHTASYFSHENIEATRLRDKLAADSLEMLIQWLKDGGNVGILGAILGCPPSRCAHIVFIDATNSTLNRRQVPSAHNNADP